MKSLLDLCEIELVRNCRYIDNFSDTPYRLIHKVLKQMKPDQLSKVEQSNPLLIFEDEQLWHQFLSQEFPSRVSESYQSKKDNLQDYLLNFIQANKPQLLVDEKEYIDDMIRNFLKKDRAKNKYRVPYKMLYSKYKHEEEVKVQESAARLRTQMQAINQQKVSKQIVTVDYNIFKNNKSMNRYTRGNSRNEHSDLFRKSLKEHQTRLKNFKASGFDIIKKHSQKVTPIPQSTVWGEKKSPNNETNADQKSHIQMNKLKEPLLPEKNQEHEGETNSVLPKPQTSNLSQVIPIKRRSGAPNIFLNRKKPTISPLSTRNKLRSMNNEVMAIEAGNSPVSKSTANAKKTLNLRGKKKKSGIFAISKPKNESEVVHKAKAPIYIHDKSK